jgi:hypothetical protein
MLQGRIPRMVRIGAVVVGLLATSGPVLARQAAPKKPITHDVYDSWRSIQGTQISRDGTWLVYALVPQDGDGEIVARNLKTGVEHRHPRGKHPLEITADAGYVVFTIAPPKAEVDRAKKEKKKPEDQPKNGLGILSLATGQIVTVDRVKSFAVPEEGSRHVAYLLEKPEGATEEKEEPKDDKGGNSKEKKKEVGAALVVRDLADGRTASIAEVTEYIWSKDGSWLAYAVSSKTAASDGAYVRQSADGSVRTLASGLGHYKGLAFDEAGRQLAFVTDRDDYARDPSTWSLFYWTPADRTASPVVTGTTPGMPRSHSVSEHGRIVFSKDGSKLFFGTAPVPFPTPGDAPEPIKVDIWSWKDPELQSMQKARAEDEKKRNYQAVLHVKDRRFVQLAAAELPNVALTEGAGVAMGAGAHARSGTPAATRLPLRAPRSGGARHSDQPAAPAGGGRRSHESERLLSRGVQRRAARTHHDGGQAIRHRDEGEERGRDRRDRSVIRRVPGSLDH